jgi:dephospho-CoA kinase
MASSFIKILGYIYYTFISTTFMIFINFFIRLRRFPNPKFYIENKIISKPLVIIYSLMNLIGFFFLCSNLIICLLFFSINEFITIGFSYYILAGFNVYGITGQICSGKSSVCDYLKRRYNATIISIDDLNREILRQNSTIKKIKKAFGNEAILRDSGFEVVNRSYLKKVIFNDKNLRKKLENITHPKVMMQFLKMLFIERFVHMRKYVFIENAILLRFELFKIIIKGVISICVNNEKILIERMMKRDNRNNNNITEETARNILNNQMSLEEFIRKSDFVIYNDENYIDLELKIDNLMLEISKYSSNDIIFVR